LYTVITENDESDWKDETGILYHFPKRYLKYLTPGTRVIYYKGTLKNKVFADQRLSDSPHYFATAIIGRVYPDKKSTKNDFFATIDHFEPFKQAVLAKIDKVYLEIIPDSRKSNYWRDGVRPINESTYHLIASKSTQTEVSEPRSLYIVDDQHNELESLSEGTPSKRYVTMYERNPKYRKQAIAIHGDSCSACGFNFGKFYGEYAEGYIHIHHVVPVSEFELPKKIDPETDLVPLCANCHSVVHQKKDKTLSINDIRNLIEVNQK